jgi:hypothetical protein
MSIITFGSIFSHSTIAALPRNIMSLLQLYRISALVLIFFECFINMPIFKNFLDRYATGNTVAVVSAMTLLFPYSFLAPRVCMWDLRLSAMTGLTLTSNAFIVSLLIVSLRLRTGVPAFAAFALSLANRFLNATSKVPICRFFCAARSRL